MHPSIWIYSIAESLQYSLTKIFCLENKCFLPFWDHSTTTWTSFWSFLTPSPSSCSRSYWMTSFTFDLYLHLHWYWEKRLCLVHIFKIFLLDMVQFLTGPVSEPEVKRPIINSKLPGFSHQFFNSLHYASRYFVDIYQRIFFVA